MRAQASLYSRSACLSRLGGFVCTCTGNCWNFVLLLPYILAPVLLFLFASIHETFCRLRVRGYLPTWSEGSAVSIIHPGSCAIDPNLRLMSILDGAYCDKLCRTWTPSSISTAPIESSTCNIYEHVTLRQYLSSFSNVITKYYVT